MRADLHSAFVMCVALSQYPMQSCKLLPPPPAVLDADSLGLLLEGVGEAAASGRPEPPAVKVVVVTAGDSGARACSWDAGAPIADAGVGGGGLAGAGSVVMVLTVAPGAADVGVEAAAAATRACIWSVCVLPRRAAL
jgi:hypothetical protein